MDILRELLRVPRGDVLRRSRPLGLPSVTAGFVVWAFGAVTFGAEGDHARATAGAVRYVGRPSNQ